MQVERTQMERLALLESWLLGGWWIEEPVLQRSVYHGLHGRVCAFEVILSHADERRVLALHDGPDVQQFLAEHQLTVLNVA